MTRMAESFPLDWPVGYPRSRSRKRAPYKATVGTARDQILRELRLMGVGDWNVIISSNAPVSARTMQMLAIRAEPADPGVAVYFRKGEKPFVLACDKWDRLADNLRALAMTLEAMRGLERWGCSEMLERVFNGFTALPAPESTSDQNLWWAVLNVSPFASLDQIEESYRKLAREYHPDTAENETVRKFRHKKMVELNQAITKARAEKRGAA